jgi:hypothetical protein
VFRRPWSVEEGETYFIIKDSIGQQLAIVYFDVPRVSAKPLTRDEARRIAANVAKLPNARPAAGHRCPVLPSSAE